MKRAIIVLLLLCMLVFPAGCTPSASVSSAAPSELPAAFEPKSTLDFGDVTMLLYSYETTQDAKELERQQRVLQAVSRSIEEQTNVKMTLHALPSSETAKKLQELISAGTPPELSTWQGSTTDADKVTGITPKPLALDAALAQYGQHLQEVIEPAQWQNYTIKGHIVAVPVLAPALIVPVLNQKAMQQNSWDMPKTAEEFDKLLEKAKQQGLMPILSGPYLKASTAWYGLDYVSVVEEEGKLVPAMGSQRRLQWLQQQQLWVTNRWMSPGNTEVDAAPYVTKGNWLCRDLPAYQLNGTADIVLLPPLSIDGGKPGYSPLENYGSFFESFARPEAMVFLLDWAFADVANMKLLSLGQKDVDYKEKADGTPQYLGDMTWEGSYQFVVEAVSKPPQTPPTYAQALEYARQSGGSYHARDGIPDMAWEYRLRGSRLDTAGLKKEEYEQKVAESELQVLQKQKSIADHQATLAQLAPLMEDYIQLIADLRSGKYDVWKDVQPVS